MSGGCDSAILQTSLPMPRGCGCGCLHFKDEDNEAREIRKIDPNHTIIADRVGTVIPVFWLQCRFHNRLSFYINSRAKEDCIAHSLNFDL